MDPTATDSDQHLLEKRIEKLASQAIAIGTLQPQELNCFSNAWSEIMEPVVIGLASNELYFPA
jgi:hypothetical protein